MTFSATTWNPADKSASCTLSGGDLIATGNMYGAVRSEFSASSGKWYWECTILSGSNAPLVGICNAEATLSGYPGFDANGWGYFGITGESYSGNTAYEYGAGFSEGETIGVALDMDAGTVEFKKNGSSQGIAFTGLTGPIYAMVAGGSSGSPASILANFGATAFLEPPPVGYTAGFGDSTPVSSTTLVERITTALQAIGADIKALQVAVGVGPGAISSGHGVVEIDFGPIGSNAASTVVTGAAGIALGASCMAAFSADGATFDHTANDHRYASALVGLTCGQIDPGVGFTIFANSSQKMTGKFSLLWIWAN